MNKSLSSFTVQTHFRHAKFDFFLLPVESSVSFAFFPVSFLVTSTRTVCFRFFTNHMSMILLFICWHLFFFLPFSNKIGVFVIFLLSILSPNVCGFILLYRIVKACVYKNLTNIKISD